jgi:O-glycosyl hydrolase
MKYQLLSTKIIALAALSTALMAAGPAAHAATATVSWTLSQPIKGWGIFPSLSHSLSDNYDMVGKTAIQNAVYALGANIIRVKLDANCGKSDGTLNTTAAPSMTDLVNQITIAKNHGVSKYILSVWSPPAYMKGPEQTILGQSSTGQVEYLRQDQETSFVNYYIKAVQYLNSHGCGLPAAISVQNELDTAPPLWDGCEYSINSNSIASWQRVVKSLRTALNNAGMGSIVIHAPEAANLDGNRLMLGGDNFPALSSDAALNTAIGAYATHSYQVLRWDAFAASVNAHPKDVWMTEWSLPGGTTQTDWAVDATRHFLADMVDMPTNYWFWWLGWRNKTSPDGQELVYGSSTPAYTKMYFVFQKIWTTANSQVTLKKMTTTDPDLKASGAGQGWPKVDMAAFETPTTTCIVIVNWTNTARTLTSINQIAKGTNADVYETNQWDDMAYKRTLPITGNAISNVALPAYGVQVIVCH